MKLEAGPPAAARPAKRREDAARVNFILEE
jgi:hypothetical protein